MIQNENENPSPEGGPPPSAPPPPPVPQDAAYAGPPIPPGVPLGWDGRPLPGAVPGPHPMPPMPPGVFPPYYALPPQPPRVWSALLVPVIAVVSALTIASVLLVIASMAELGPDALRDRTVLNDWLKSFGSTPGGFALLVLPGQLTFLAAAIAAAALSPAPTLRRLGLNRPNLPWPAIPLLILATPFAGICGDLLMTTIFGEQRGEHLEMLYNLFRGPSGAFLVMVTLLVSVLPGFSEEMLFRGYTQGRLLQRWHPTAAIGLSSLMFAAAHADPAHVVAVIPLGIWFGVISWLTGSVWPTIICHTANNAVAVLMTNAEVADPTEHVQLDATGLTMLGVSGALVLLSVWVMVRYRRKAQGRGFPVNAA